VHSITFPPLDYFPCSQFIQLSFIFFAPICPYYPIGQSISLHDTDIPPSEYSPFLHDVHPFVKELAPFLVAYLPRGQSIFSQVSPSSDYCPIGHSKQIFLLIDI